MNSKEIEGKLAAVEFIATISLHNTLKYWWASGYPTRVPFLRDWIVEQIDSGSFPGPTDEEAREAMKASLVSMITSTPSPDGMQLQEISERHDAHYFGEGR